MTQENLLLLREHADRALSIRQRRTTVATRVRACFECGARTNDGKPYCIAHLDLLPYPRAVRRSLEARQAEVARVREGGARAVELRGSRAREILALIDVHGAFTRHGLERAVELPSCAMESYLAAMEAAGLVRVERVAKTNKTKAPRFVVLPTRRGGAA